MKPASKIYYVYQQLQGIQLEAFVDDDPMTWLFVRKEGLFMVIDDEFTYAYNRDEFEPYSIEERMDYKLPHGLPEYRDATKHIYAEINDVSTLPKNHGKYANIESRLWVVNSVTTLLIINEGEQNMYPTIDFQEFTPFIQWVNALYDFPRNGFI